MSSEDLAMTLSVSRNRLRIVAVVLPVLFLALIDFARHALFPDQIHSLWGTLGSGAVVTLGALAFSRFVFGVVDRLQERVISQNNELMVLYERVRGQVRQLKALHGVAQGLIGELDTNALLSRIVGVSRELVAARYAALGIADSSGKLFRFFFDGVDEETRRLIGDPPIGRGIVGYVLKEGVSVRVPDIAADPRFVGFPPHHPVMRSFLGVPLKMKGTVIGALYLADKEAEGHFTDEDEELVSLLASQAAVAIENARLYQEAMAVAAMEERERIAHDLHDNIIQSLYAVGLSLERAERRLEREPQEARRRIVQAIEEINGIMRDIRNYIFGLGASDAEGADLSTALQQIVKEFEVNSLAAGHLEVGPELPELSLSARAHLLQFVREALSNVLKHASAKQVWVSVGRCGNELVATVQDDGVGFEPERLGQARGYGLRNLAERARSLRGSFHVESAPGAGTVVLLRFPVDPVTVG